MVENNGVDYRDDTPLSQADIDYVNKLVEKDEYSTAGKKIANWLKTKLYGKPTRGAMSLWAAIIGESTQKNHQIAKNSATKVDNIGQRFDDQIAGSTNDNEMIDLRHSDMLSKSFTTARKRGDFWDDEFRGRGVNVKWFGAVGDGVNDDTSAIQQAIDYFKDSNYGTLIFQGIFLLSETGKDDDGRAYALRLDGLTQKNIDFTKAKFVTAKSETVPNLFAFYNCSKIKISGGEAVANIADLTSTPLYNGAFIYSNECDCFVINEVSTSDMPYLACIFNSNLGQIKGNMFTHSQQSAARVVRPNSAILLYNSSKFKVINNDINGGLKDGDLSIFGANSYSNLIAFNHLRAETNWEEAITVDGGAKKTTVTNNIIEGYYNYGIDVKYNSEHTAVTDNSIYGCVTGICTRGGEIGNAPVFESVIHNNNIVFGNIPSNQGWGDARQKGIYISDVFSADVQDNHLTLGTGDVNYVIWGIYCTLFKGSSNDYYSPISISTNYIELENGYNEKYQKAGVDSCCLVLDSMLNTKASNNTFKAPEGLLAVKLLGNNKIIMFNGNTFRTNTVTPIQLYGNASCERLVIGDNNISTISAVSNTYLWYTNIGQDHLTMLLNKRELTNTEHKAFLLMKTSQPVSLIIKVKMIYDDGGTFLADSSYQVYLTDKTLSITPLSENNKDIVIDSDNITSDQHALFAKAERTVNTTGVHYHIDAYGQDLDKVTFS